jgi:hypothetical protein
MSLPVIIGLLVLSFTVALIAKIVEERNALKGADRSVLNQLRAAGSDLSQPHCIDFFLFAPTQAAASALGARLETFGFTSTLAKEPVDSTWSVVAVKTIVPTESALAAIRQQLSQEAKALGGVYDGWGSAIVPQAGI